MIRVMGIRIPAAASLIVWCVVWEIVGHLDLIPILPPFSAVLSAILRIAPTQQFQEGALITLGSFAVGMVGAIAAGVALGVLMGRVEAAERLLGMWVNVFASAPLSALVPVLMILFGLGSTTVVVAVILFAVWIVVLDTAAGIKHVNPSLVDMARSFGAGRMQILFKIYALAALPEILAGVRLGLIRGVKGVVIGQLLVSIVGFGAMFELYSRNFLMEEFWALTIVLFAFAILISEAVALAERKIEFYSAVR